MRENPIMGHRLDAGCRAALAGSMAKDTASCPGLGIGAFRSEELMLNPIAACHWMAGASGDGGPQAENKV
jgi:hypothetical protein